MFWTRKAILSLKKGSSLVGSSAPAKELYLLDASSYIYRAFHALPKFTTKEGIPTGAIYGFTRMLLSLLNKKNVKHMAVCFDSKTPTFRHREFPDYKKTRPPMPEDLQCQLPKICQILDAFHIARFQMDGYEADDILATLVSKLKDKFNRILIVTSDKDMLQLVTEKINVLNSFSQDNLLNPIKVKEKVGVLPEKIPDLFALIGDSVDNIPGIPGIGKKTAKELLDKFGFLEDVITSKGEIKNRKIAESLDKNSLLALNNKKLLILEKNVPIDVNVDELVVIAPDRHLLNKIFEDLQFKKLAKELEPTLFS
jgi:DNA polymerase-1